MTTPTPTSPVKTGRATESIWAGKYATIPLAEVQHTEKRGSEGGITVVMKSTRYDFAADEWANPVGIGADEAQDFLSAWCCYRSELEADTLMDLVPLPAEPVAGDAEGKLRVYWATCAADSDSHFSWYRHEPEKPPSSRRRTIRFIEWPESWTPPRPGEASAEQELLSQFAQLCDLIMGSPNSTAPFREVKDRVQDLLKPPASAAREWVLEGDEERNPVIRHGSALNHGERVRVREVHPVTPEVPEGVPVPPDGFDYFDVGPLRRLPFTGEESRCVIAYRPEIGKWDEAPGLNGTSPTLHYAIRRGTELHRRNFTP